VGETIDVRILGPIEVRCSDVVLPLGGAKQRAVLAMLVLHLNRIVSVEHLVDGLWGDDPPLRALNVIQAYISRLRKVLSGSDGQVPGAWGVHRRQPGYVLELPPECCDLIRFQRLLDDGTRQVATDPHRAAELLGSALSLWRGEPLAEFTGEAFAAVEKVRLAELHLKAVLTRSEANLSIGRHDDAIAELQASIVQHPLHEGLRERLLVGLYLAGRQADALDQFRQFQQVLGDELGLYPGKQLTQLQSAILTGDPIVGVPYLTSPATPVADPPRGNGERGSAEPETDGRSIRVRKLPGRNPYFAGRDDVIERLRLRLRSGEQNMVVQALFGMGGVGKTQIAIEYAHRHVQEYSIVWWIDAELPVLIAEQMTALAARLGLATAGPTSHVIDDVLAHLAARSDWLLIFDNARRSTDIANYLPGGAGHVVVTSRHPGWGGLGGRLPVDVMPRPETIQLLTSRIPGLEADVLDALAEELGDLPLAAAQAAAYLEQTDLPPGEYLRQFRQRRAALLAGGDVVGYEGRLNTTWELSLEKLRDVSTSAIDLLRFGSFLAPEPIPLDIVAAHSDVLTGSLRDVASDGPDALSDAVGAAVSLSLVQRQEQSFVMHRLVQAVVRQRLSPAEQATLGAEAVGLLAASLPGDPMDPREWSSYSRLASHVLAVGEWCDESAQGRELMLRTAAYLNARGDNAASRRMSEGLLERWRQVLGRSHPATLALASMLTSALAWLGEAPLACELGQDTLERCRATLGADHPTTLSTATYLTSALAWVGNSVEATLLGRDTLERCRNALGPHHPATLSSAAQWSFTLLGIGQLEPAIELSRETMELATSNLGPSHPTTLVAASALTIALAWIGQPDTAQQLGARTSRLCHQAFGAEHWLSLVAQSALGFALIGAGDVETAEPLCQEAFHRAELTVGSDHWVTLIAGSALTHALVGRGDTEQAMRVGKATLDRSRVLLGEQHPITESLRGQLDAVGGSETVTSSTRPG
jgi:DNA-binding SARP family transcriptional activator